MRSRRTEVSPFAPPSEWFDRWWDALDFLSAVTRHADPVPQDILFNEPEMAKLLEAVAAAQFAAIRNLDTPIQIRLEADRFPDFRLTAKAAIEEFELVEADEQGRRRGDEYREVVAREAAGLPPLAETFDPAEVERRALPAIAKALAAKAKKNYRPPPNILVYVNFELFRELPLTNLQASELVHPYQSIFPSIWLLWGRNAARLCPRQAVRARSDQDAGNPQLSAQPD